MTTIVRMMHHLMYRGFTLPIWVFFLYVVALTFKECLSKTLRRNAIIIKFRYDFNSMVEIRHEKSFVYSKYVNYQCKTICTSRDK